MTNASYVTVETGKYSQVASKAAMMRALAQAKGSYQRDLIHGHEALSGSTLRGKAARYSAHYAASARNLMDRLRAAGLSVSELRAEHGRRVLVIAEAC